MPETIKNDVLQVQGINAKGYGTIPKLVMQDRRLTPQAKAIYSYFCSYAGAGKIAFPRTDRIVADLVMGRNAYYKHFSQLKEYGYIKVDQEKNRAGHFARNIYTIMQIVPCTKKGDTVNSHAHAPDTAENSVNTHAQPCTKKRYTDKRDTVNQATNNNRFEKEQSLNINRGESAHAPERPVQAYGEFKRVCMTTEQYDALVTAYGREKAADYVDRLDRHIASSGKSYADHYATIVKWIGEDERKQQSPAKSNTSRFINYQQRKNDYNELERLEMEQNRKGVSANA